MIWTHNKTGKPYLVLKTVLNKTDKFDMQKMILYRSMSRVFYVREIKEFHSKFTVTKFTKFTDIKLNPYD